MPGSMPVQGAGPLAQRKGDAGRWSGDEADADGAGSDGDFQHVRDGDEDDDEHDSADEQTDLVAPLSKKSTPKGKHKAGRRSSKPRAGSEDSGSPIAASKSKPNMSLQHYQSFFANPFLHTVPHPGAANQQLNQQTGSGGAVAGGSGRHILSKAQQPARHHGPVPLSGPDGSAAHSVLQSYPQLAKVLGSNAAAVAASSSVQSLPRQDSQMVVESSMRKNPFTAKFLASVVQIDRAMFMFFREWINDLGFTHLPRLTALKCLDYFTFEGVEVYVRLLLSMIHSNQQLLAECKTESELCGHLTDICAKQYDPQKFFAAVEGVPFDIKEIITWRKSEIVSRVCGDAILAYEHTSAPRFGGVMVAPSIHTLEMARASSTPESNPPLRRALGGQLTGLSSPPHQAQLLQNIAAMSIPFYSWGHGLLNASSILRHPEESLLIAKLHPTIRASLALRSPVCAYSTDKNGYGVSNMFAQLRAREDQLIDYCFLLVRSTSDYVFGAFLSHLPIPQPKLRPEEFFGDHSCFLFRLRPLSEVRVYRAASLRYMQADADASSTDLSSMAADPSSMSVLAASESKESVRLARKHHKDFIMASESPKSIGVGAGEKGFGIFLRDSMRYGWSFPTETFSNTCLCSSTRHLVGSEPNLAGSSIGRGDVSGDHKVPGDMFQFEVASVEVIGFLK